MRAKLGIVVFPSIWCRNKALFLADIAGAPHADKAAFDQVIRYFVMEGKGFSKDSQVVGIATDHLDEAVLARHQRLIVDATRIRLAKARLTPLGEKPLGGRHMLEPVNLMLIGHAVWCAINDHGGLIQGLLNLISGLHAQ